MGRRFTLAITGASGSGFGVAALKRLATRPDVDAIALLISPMGRRCLSGECGLGPEDLAALSPKIRLLDEGDLGASISSGSHPQGGMVVLPCSAGTLGRIASGTSDTLIARAADVCLKERHPLVLCLRETPLNRVHLENMLRAHDAGAVLMPLMPGYYCQPQSIGELFDAFATRVLDQLGLTEEDSRRWQG